jgi:hypothetical protein
MLNGDQVARMQALFGTGRRPKPACHVAPKRSDGEPSVFVIRFYEAAARDLTHLFRVVGYAVAQLGGSFPAMKSHARPALADPTATFGHPTATAQSCHPVLLFCPCLSERLRRAKADS